MTTVDAVWQDRAVPWVLRTSTTSPFGRKVRIAAMVLGLDARLIRHDASTVDPDDDLRQQNPLGKIPCLMVGTEAVFDSTVILEMLDDVAGGGRIIPPAGTRRRYRALTQATLASGITDAALLIVYEARFRPDAPPSAIWLDHQRGKIARALDAFEKAPPDPARPDIVAISLACALAYLDWRRPVLWRDEHPRLVCWLAEFAAATPAFSATESERT